MKSYPSMKSILAILAFLLASVVAFRCETQPIPHVNLEEMVPGHNWYCFRFGHGNGWCYRHREDCTSTRASVSDLRTEDMRVGHCHVYASAWCATAHDQEGDPVSWCGPSYRACQIQRTDHMQDPGSVIHPNQTFTRVSLCEQVWDTNLGE